MWPRGWRRRAHASPGPSAGGAYRVLLRACAMEREQERERCSREEALGSHASNCNSAAGESRAMADDDRRCKSRSGVGAKTVRWTGLPLTEHATGLTNTSPDGFLISPCYAATPSTLTRQSASGSRRRRCRPETAGHRGLPPERRLPTAPQATVRPSLPRQGPPPLPPAPCTRRRDRAELQRGVVCSRLRSGGRWRRAVAVGGDGRRHGGPIQRPTHPRPPRRIARQRPAGPGRRRSAP